MCRNVPRATETLDWRGYQIGFQYGAVSSPVLLQQFHARSRPATSLSHFLQSSEEPTLYLASDGSSDEPLGSYGYVISDNKATIFFQGTDTAYGPTPSSFRSEAYGALACFRFLIRYLEYHNLQVSPTASIKYFCDNESLIKTLRRLAAAPTLYPKDMIRSDYDLIISILNSLPALPFHISFHHVKGHQAPSPDPRLPWEANLNIICNSIATGALCNATAQPLVSPNPFCPIQLILQDSSVHSHFRSRLSSHQFIAPDLTSYLIKRNDWPDEILHTINWSAHSTSLHKFPISHRPFLCKLIH